MLLFQLFTSLGASLALAHIASFFAAAALNYSLDSKWSFRPRHANDQRWRHFGRFLTVGLFALLMRGGVLALLVFGWHMSPMLAIFPAVAVTAAINYLGSAFYVFPVKQDPPTVDVRWRVASLGIVAFAILLRLIYLGQAQLIPDEAYYWNYAQHMDLSFYDHPPMVAWLIWLGTAIFGNTEFGVRIGAFICGLITMGYLYALARNLYDKSTAMRAVLLLAVLPFYFSTGMVMTTDAPLVAAWAATLYYMERALIADQNSAWLGMGIAFGLGILSKYTLGLLGPAALLFVILDPASRRWLRRPQPYLAAALALLLFSPVIIWNMENDWASIMFQSNRVKGGSEDQFAAHLLFLHLMVLLTPVGLLAAAMAVWPGAERDRNAFARRRRLFVRVFTGLPLAVFVCSQHFRVAAVSLDRTDMARTAADHGMVDGPGRRFQYPLTPRESGLETHYCSLPLSLRIGTALRGARHPRHPLWRFVRTLFLARGHKGNRAGCSGSSTTEPGKSPLW